MSNRTWPLVLLGAVATAAVIGVVAFVGGLGGDDEPGPAAATTQPSETSRPTTGPTEAEPTAATGEPQPTGTTATPPAAGAVPVYYIGDTERGGPRLYREFQRGSGDPFEAAVAVLTGTPLDPDYRTAWPAGSITDVSFDGVGADGVIGVQLADASYAERPAGMSDDEAEAAVMQVVYTLQAAVQARAGVDFRAGSGERLDTVYGVDTSEPLSNGSILETLSHMSITTPEQGGTATGTLELTGVANSFEASAGWELRRGDEVVKRGAWMAEGWMEDRLFPFEVSIDLDGVPPGDYTVWATTDDPTGGTEGAGAMSDDKDVTVR